MTVKQKLTGRAASLPVGLALGLVVSAIITVLIAALTAHMVSTEIIPQDWIGYCAMIALMTATIIGAMAAAGKANRMPVQIALMNGGLFFGVLLAATALFFGGQYQGMGVTLAVVLVGSGAGGILSRRLLKKNVRKRSKKTYW